LTDIVESENFQNRSERSPVLGSANLYSRQSGLSRMVLGISRAQRSFFFETGLGLSQAHSFSEIAPSAVGNTSLTTTRSAIMRRETNHSIFHRDRRSASSHVGVQSLLIAVKGRTYAFGDPRHCTTFGSIVIDRTSGGNRGHVKILVGTRFRYRVFSLGLDCSLCATVSGRLQTAISVRTVAKATSKPIALP
jgi:hypothetical protein